MRGMRIQGVLGMSALWLLGVLGMSALAPGARLVASDVTGVGKVVKIQNGSDTLLVFDGEPHLRVSLRVGQTDWYRTDGTLIQNNTDEIYPQSGEGVRVTIDGKDQIYYVFDYNDYRPSLTGVTVIPYCTRTDVTIEGTVPPMQYTTPTGQTKTYGRLCSIAYTTLAWDGEQWSDSVAVAESQSLHVGTTQLPVFYAPTQFVVRYEALADSLGVEPDSVLSEMVEPIAVSAHPTSQTTVRGQAGERSNEVDRPTDAGTLRGSAPLEIEFRANGTPTAEYYDWRVYRSSDLVVSRTDPQHRYTFMEPGNYRVVCRVSGNRCPCQDGTDPDCAQDSTVFEVAVSESQLLVPNVFTPNGDGQNDEFRVQYRSLREFHCWVYNRWGKLVYEWTDPSKGWDGMIGGRQAAEGAYYYVIRALGTDAPEHASYGTKASYNNKVKSSDESVIGVYRLSGDINLIRGK